MTPIEPRSRSAQKTGKKKAPAKETAAPKAAKEIAPKSAAPAKEIAKEVVVEPIIDDSQAALIPPKVSTERTQYEMGEEYLWQIHFDKVTGKYFGSVLEFPEVRAEGVSRDAVIQELSHQVQQKLVAMKMAGECYPEPILQKMYPDKIEIPISQSLYRRLDIYSRQERIGLEQLVGEVLTQLIERRGENRSQQRQQNQPQHDRGGDRGHQRYDNRDRHRHQHQRNHQHQGASRGGGYNQGGMDNGDNFMEYVRNLEKRGGSPGKFRR